MIIPGVEIDKNNFLNMSFKPEGVVTDFFNHISNFGAEFVKGAIPDSITILAYISFFVVQIGLAAYVPGMLMEGLPIDDKGTRLKYLCNGYLCYYICIYGVVFAYFYGIYDLSHLCENVGKYITAAVVVADVTSVFWYFYGLDEKTKEFLTGNPIYDFFMGSVLYPRIGIVDIKMIAECRWSWLTLFLLTASCALKMYKERGFITKEMGVMLVAHWLYSNATVKGEHCIPCTWDMFHERFGWMLNFWNIAGVPYLYCFQSFYIYKNWKAVNTSLSVPFISCVYVLLIVSYYIFDSANSQKATMKITGMKRNTFPQVPWSILEQPVRMLQTPKGDLLIDGWYAFARKMQYTGDILMALCWGLACGFASPLNYFYCLFFTCMILHRQSRDEVRCKLKYGEYWDIYTHIVPNVFLPSPKFFSWLFSDDKVLKEIDIEKIKKELADKKKRA